MAYDTILVKEICILGRSALLGNDTITPGFLLARDSVNGLVPHWYRDGIAVRMIAIEKPGADINTRYKPGDMVYYKVCHSGEQIYGLLSKGQTVVPGTFLSSSGNGMFKKATDIRYGHSLGVALEEVQSDLDSRLLIEII
jgi:hypothetical protein